MTIVEAIKKAMLDQGSPLTAKEAFRAIVDSNLYEFHADDPEHVVSQQIRRHCEGIDYPSAAPTKHFQLVGENRFWPLAKLQKIPSVKQIKKERKSTKRTPLVETLNALETLHERYVTQLKEKILADLKQLSPNAFEAFAKQLLDVYGFHDTHVTQTSGDGGIDGYGKLRVGLASLNVSFQCKRWTKGNIQRPEIDKFRGASQGDYEQGIFFTTASFSQGSIDASIKRGAIPVVLLDGKSIVDLMIDKGFGVQNESLSLPSYALDLVFAEAKN